MILRDLIGGSAWVAFDPFVRVWAQGPGDLRARASPGLTSRRAAFRQGLQELGPRAQGAGGAKGTRPCVCLRAPLTSKRGAASICCPALLRRVPWTSGCVGPFGTLTSCGACGETPKRVERPGWHPSEHLKCIACVSATCSVSNVGPSGLRCVLLGACPAGATQGVRPLRAGVCYAAPS